MKLYDIEVIERLDETSGESEQPLEMNFKFMDGTKEYEADVTGVAFVKTLIIVGDRTTPDQSEIEVEILLTEYYVYFNGFNEPLFNTVVSEDDLLEVLKEHCS